MSCNKIKSLRLQRSSQRSEPPGNVEDMSMILAEETKTHVERIELSSRNYESPTRLHSTPKRSTDKSHGAHDQGSIDYRVSPILLPCTQDGGNDVAWDWQSPLAKSKLTRNKPAETIGTPKRTSMLQKKRNSNSPLLYKPTKRKLLRNDQESIDKFTAEMKAISEQFKTVPRGDDDPVTGQKPNESEDDLFVQIDDGDFVESAGGADESSRKNGQTVDTVRTSMDDLFDDSIEDSMVKCSQEVEEKLRLESCRESSSKRNSDTSASGKDSPPSWHQNSYSRFLTSRDKTPDEVRNSPNSTNSSTSAACEAKSSAFRPKSSSSSTGNFSGDAKATFGLPNQTKATFGVPNQTKATFGVPNQTKSTSGITSQPKSTSAISNQPKLTSGISNQPKLTSGTSNQSKLTSAISNQSKLTSAISNQSKLTSGISSQLKSNSGISSQSKSNSGISSQSKSNSGISNQPKSNSGISNQPKSSCINNNVTAKPGKTVVDATPSTLTDVFEINDSFDDFMAVYSYEPESPAAKAAQDSSARYGKFYYASPHSAGPSENPKRTDSSSARRVLLPPPSQSSGSLVKLPTTPGTTANAGKTFSRSASNDNLQMSAKSSSASQKTTITMSTTTTTMMTTTATNQGRKFFKTKSLSTSSFEDHANEKNTSVSAGASLSAKGWKSSIFANGSVKSCVSSNGKTITSGVNEVLCAWPTTNGGEAANRVVGGVNVDRNGPRNGDSLSRLASQRVCTGGTQSAKICTPEEIERKRLEAKMKLEAKRKLMARSTSSGSLSGGSAKRFVKR